MPKKILVVDNNPVILKLMTTLLEQEGHEVKTAPDGLSALYMLDHFVPRVIFVDLVMPNISGEKLCRIIRDMPRCAETSLVILSAIAAEQDISPREYGADACIAKGSEGSIKKHVLAVLAELDKKERPPSFTDDLTIGLENIHTREVTRELLSSQKHFEAIVHNMADAVFELTRDGTIIYANQAAIGLTGLKEERLLAASFPDLFTADAGKQVKSLVARALSTPQSIDENLPLMINGSYVAANLLPVPNGPDTSIIVMLRDVTKRIMDETALTASDARYRELFAHMLSGVAVYEATNNGKDFIFVDFNKAAERIENIRRDEVIGKNVKDVFAGVEKFGLLKVMRRVWKNGISEELPLSFYQDDRIVGWRENFVYKLPSGEIVALFRDITDQKKAEENLAFESGMNQAIAKLSQMLISANSMADIARVLLDQAMKLTASPRGFLGYFDEEKGLNILAGHRTSGKTQTTQHSLQEKDGPGLLGEVLKSKKTLLANSMKDQPRQSGLPHDDIPIHRLLAAPALLGNQVIGEVALANAGHNYSERDRTIVEQLASLYALALEKNRHEQQITRLAHHDQLTGLVNRHLLPDRIAQALFLAKRNGKQVATLYMDLDNFKKINDTFGHRLGDEVLHTLAERFTAILRASDTIARMGGDEFVFVLQDIKCEEDAETVARKINRAVAQPLALNGRNLTVKASIGISLFPGNGTDGDQLLQKADEAMYGVKERGGNGHGFYKQPTVLPSR